MLPHFCMQRPTRAEKPCSWPVVSRKHKMVLWEFTFRLRFRTILQGINAYWMAHRILLTSESLEELSSLNMRSLIRRYNYNKPCNFFPLEDLPHEETKILKTLKVVISDKKSLSQFIWKIHYIQAHLTFPPPKPVQITKQFSKIQVSARLLNITASGSHGAAYL